MVQKINVKKVYLDFSNSFFVFEPSQRIGW